MGSATIRLEPAQDVLHAGVLCGIPALLALGLLRHTKSNFILPPGYDPLESIFLAMAFMALARVTSLESLRYEPPGEWGKLLGLDRIPEVKTLRSKLADLTGEGTQVHEWSATLAKEWLEAEPSCAGTLDIDGHVRGYHGSLTPLPRRFVARQKLCLHCSVCKRRPG